MEIAFDLLSRMVGRGDDPGTGFGVADGSGHEVGKISDAPFGAGRERFGSRRPDDQRTPGAAIDEYRRAYGGTQAERSKAVGKLAPRAVVAIHPGRSALSLDQRSDAVALQ